jgi:hypothetical protein
VGDSREQERKNRHEKRGDTEQTAKRASSMFVLTKRGKKNVDDTRDEITSDAEHRKKKTRVVRSAQDIVMY